MHMAKDHIYGDGSAVDSVYVVRRRCDDPD